MKNLEWYLRGWQQSYFAINWFEIMYYVNSIRMYLWGAQIEQNKLFKIWVYVWEDWLFKQTELMSSKEVSDFLK